MELPVLPTLGAKRTREDDDNNNNTSLMILDTRVGGRIHESTPSTPGSSIPTMTTTTSNDNFHHQSDGYSSKGYLEAHHQLQLSKRPHLETEILSEQSVRDDDDMSLPSDPHQPIHHHLHPHDDDEPLSVEPLAGNDDGAPHHGLPVEEGEEEHGVSSHSFHHHHHHHSHHQVALEETPEDHHKAPIMAHSPSMINTTASSIEDYDDDSTPTPIMARVKNGKFFWSDLHVEYLLEVLSQPEFHSLARTLGMNTFTLNRKEMVAQNKIIGEMMSKKFGYHDFETKSRISVKLKELKIKYQELKQLERTVKELESTLKDSPLLLRARSEFTEAKAKLKFFDQMENLLVIATASEPGSFDSLPPAFFSPSSILSSSSHSLPLSNQILTGKLHDPLPFVLEGGPLTSSDPTLSTHVSADHSSTIPESSLSETQNPRLLHGALLKEHVDLYKKEISFLRELRNKLYDDMKRAMDLHKANPQDSSLEEYLQHLTERRTDLNTHYLAAEQLLKAAQDRSTRFESTYGLP